MKIILSGSNGLIGQALYAHFKQANHTVIRLVRKSTPISEERIVWDPNSRELLKHPLLEECDAIIHLAGENIAHKRWTTNQKQRIRNSRVEGTTLLAQSIAQLTHPPKVFLSASAIGFYGDRDDELLDEKSTEGNGYLSSVCKDWESATIWTTKAGIRTLQLRIGVVISNQGGALKRMLTPFNLGLGGKIGSGKQWMSWIDIEDVTLAIAYLLEHSKVQGPVNLVSPHVVTNKEFTHILGKIISRPTFCSMPGFAAKILFGEMAEALLLTSAHISPTVLIKEGFTFKYPHLHEALLHVLKG